MGAWSLSRLRREIHGASAGYPRRDRTLHAPRARSVAVHVCDRRGYIKGGAVVQEVHLAKSSPTMEEGLRKRGEDIKRGLCQPMDRTHRSPRQQIQCGGGWRVAKFPPQKPCLAPDDTLILPHRTDRSR